MTDALDPPGGPAAPWPGSDGPFDTGTGDTGTCTGACVCGPGTCACGGAVLLRRLDAVVCAVHDQLRRVSEARSGCSAAGPAVLVCVLRRPGSATHDLARSVGLTRSGAVRSLDRLEAAGLVVRRDGADHRTSRVWLTDAGVLAARRLLDARRQVGEQLLAELPAEHKAALDAVLARLGAALLAGHGHPMCRMCAPADCWPGCPGTGGPR
jgi:DNA-binding MarR family transcriptional regulator